MWTAGCHRGSEVFKISVKHACSSAAQPLRQTHTAVYAALNPAAYTVKAKAIIQRLLPLQMQAKHRS
jgi:hypothetical protein